MITYGPVPSRRLGRSLGINNIPPKTCTYSCIYCQLGRTLQIQNERTSFYETEEIMKEVSDRVSKSKERGESIDYITYVPDGEPTLDVNLGKEIEMLRELDKKVAVITNASLLWMEDVRVDLCKSDWVSVKIDTVTRDIWNKINNPHRSLDLMEILNGIMDFSRVYKGKLTTETMLIQGINDETVEISKIADFVADLKPEKSYLSIPTRPPTEKWVKPADEKVMNEACQIFNSEFINVEYLIGYEGNAFAFTGDVEADILSITAVHPMREDGIRVLLSRSNEDWGVIERLIHQGKLTEMRYDGKKFYLRTFYHNPIKF